MEQKPKRKPQSKSNFSFLLGLFLGLLSTFLCAIFLMSAYVFITEDKSQAYITTSEQRGDEARESISQYNPPMSATDFYWYSNRGFTSDYDRKIRFSLPAVDVEQWLVDSGLCFELPLETNTRTVGSSDSLTWWQPSNAETFIGGRCGDNPHYMILIDQTDTATWIVYLEVFKT
jgi:hypothetical protein